MEFFKNPIFIKSVSILVLILVAIILYAIIKKIIGKIFTINLKKVNNKKQKTLKSFFINILKCITIILTSIIGLEILGINTSVIITSFGAVTVVIGLAFQDILKDFIAGISLIFENSYNLGDVITINGFKGEVIYMGMKATKIKAATGEVLIINNGSIKEIINHTIENALAIVDVSISYDEDIEKVDKVLNQLAKQLNNKIDNIKGNISVLGIEKLADSSVIFRITAPTAPNCQYTVQRELRKYIKIELDKNNIEIPYNQLVIHSE